YLPSPMDVDAITGTNPETEQEVIRRPSESDPFCALAFKIATDPFVGRLGFIRVYSGRLDAGSYAFNSRSGKKERISRIYQMHSNKQNPIEFVGAGDIAAAVGFKDVRTGDTLCDEKNPITLESMTFPDPVIGLAVEPKTQKDLDKLGVGLQKLAEEDPTFTVRTDETSGQTVISGMGELHLEIIVDRLRREFGVEINQGAPQVNYKEALTKPIEMRELFKKQSGGRGKFADIIFELGPCEDKEKQGLEFVDVVKGGNIPKEFIPAVQKGFASAMANGALAGFPIDSMKVTLKDGSFHAVDSDSLSFEICARNGFRHAALKAGPQLMEPVMAVEVVTPEENMGDIIGDLNKRRGQISGMEQKGTARVVKARVPLSEMFGYVTVLRTISSGRATSSMEFSHYDAVPAAISKEIIEKSSGRVAGEDE
ncbi:MAG: EF-Tu/IF-2/RF-3 family GTPase, partial [Mucinivorans sp.]